MGNPLTGGVRGELRNLRGKHKETKWRKFTTEIEPNGNFQLSSSSYTCIHPQLVGVGCGGLDCGDQSSCKRLGLNAMKVL